MVLRSLWLTDCAAVQGFSVAATSAGLALAVDSVTSLTASVIMVLAIVTPLTASQLDG